MGKSSRRCFGRRRMSSITSDGRSLKRCRKEKRQRLLEESRQSTLVLPSLVGAAVAGVSPPARHNEQEGAPTRRGPRVSNHEREDPMFRQLFLAAAFASLMSSTASADITILVPSGSEGDGLRAAAAD